MNPLAEAADHRDDQRDEHQRRDEEPPRALGFGDRGRAHVLSLAQRSGPGARRAASLRPAG
jgi:hypothetical protein